MAKYLKKLFFVLNFFVLQNLFVYSATIRNKNFFNNDRSSRTEIIEGDILIRKKPINDCTNSNNKTTSIQLDFLWPDGVIPFDIDPLLVSHNCIIRSAMLHIMMKSCIYFRQKTASDKQYLKIFKGNGCYATVGRNAHFSEAKLSLGLGCNKFGIILHQLMHVLGFEHEHRRVDRDQFVVINYENIENNQWHHFDKNQECEETSLTPFDINSVMLYSSKAFSKDGTSETIQSKIKGQVVKEDKSNDSLSRGDADSVALLYSCTTTPLERHHICEKFLKSFWHMKSCRIEAATYLDPHLVKLYMSHVDANRSCDQFITSHCPKQCKTL